MNKSIVKYKPLFLSTEYNVSTNQYEFEKLLIDVLDTVIKKKQGNDNFLKQKIFIGESKLKNVSDYLKSSLSIHFEQSSSQLYSSRMIATHLSYIEGFRSYLNSDESMVEKIHENNLKYGGKNLVDINIFILKNIEQKYANLCLSVHPSLVDDSVFNIMKKWNEKIAELLLSKRFDLHIEDLTDV